ETPARTSLTVPVQWHRLFCSCHFYLPAGCRPLRFVSLGRRAGAIRRFVPQEFHQQPLLVLVQLQLAHEVRTLEEASPQRLLVTPAPDPGVIPREEYLRHPPARDRLRPRVMRMIEESLAEGVPLRR